MFKAMAKGVFSFLLMFFVVQAALRIVFVIVLFEICMKNFSVRILNLIHFKTFCM